MAGRFEGLTDIEWKIFEDLFLQPKKRGKGMPPVPPRKVLNTLIYIMITGCRWCDLPKGSKWSSKSSAHRWLKRWYADGTLKEIQARVLGLAQNEELICWDSGAVDGSFSPGKGGGGKVDYGYKGKGILIHLLVDMEGMPLAASTTAANGNEREQVEPLLDQVEVKTGKPGRPPKKPKKLAADKGYDKEELREKLRQRGIKPQISKRKNAKKRPGRPVKMDAPRFQVERAFSWLQRKFRRLVVRWERLPECYDAFLSLAISYMWIQKLVG